jgi:HlyD family secretion protein
MDQTVERPKVNRAPNIGIEDIGIEESLGLDVKGRGRERRRRWMLWGAVLLLAIAGLGTWRWFDQAPAKIAYVTALAEKRDLTIKVSATGTLQPLTQVDVSSELSGVVRSVAVDENQQVKKGDVLAVLDKSRILAQIDGAKASVLAAEAQVEQAQTTLADTSRTLDRTRQLAAKGMAAMQALDTATADRDRAQAALSVANANVAVAQANEKLQETDLDKSTIYAPIDGVVLTRSVDPGQTVASSFSAPVLFIIAQDLKSMQLEAAIDEADIGRVAKGQAGHFTVDAFPSQHFDAKISDIAYASVTTDNVVTYEAKLDVDNSRLLLRPGMTAAVDIVTRQADGVLTVPNAAFRYSPPVPDAGGRRAFSLRDLFMPRFRGRRERTEAPATSAGMRAVYVLRDGRPHKTMVKPGDTDGAFTEILSGLEPGDKVITSSSREGN